MTDKNVHVQYVDIRSADELSRQNRERGFDGKVNVAVREFRRPDNAPDVDEPCEKCGEAMGEEWGVVTFTFGFMSMLEYLPVHSACWWAERPVDRERLKARFEEEMAEMERVVRMRRKRAS